MVYAMSIITKLRLAEKRYRKYNKGRYNIKYTKKSAAISLSDTGHILLHHFYIAIQVAVLAHINAVLIKTI